MFKEDLEELKERGRRICGICCSDMGPSNKKEGEISYCGCENDPINYNEGR